MIIPELPLQSSPTPHRMELLGIATRQLIHDISNQLVVITVNTCVAEDFLHDQERIAFVLKMVTEAGERAGKLVSEFRELSATCEPTMDTYPADIVQDILGTACENSSQWKLITYGALDGTLQLDLSLFRFALSEFLNGCAEGVGQVELSMRNRGLGPLIPPGGSIPRLLQIRYLYPVSSPGAQAVEASARSLELISAEECVRINGGWLERTHADNAINVLTILLPIQA